MIWKITENRWITIKNFHKAKYLIRVILLSMFKHNIYYPKSIELIKTLFNNMKEDISSDSELYLP